MGSHSAIEQLYFTHEKTMVYKDYVPGPRYILQVGGESNE